MARTRLLRAYAGVRPLVAVDGDESGRNISRGIVLLDHAERDGLKGFNTITGGKLMTYRLMAEWPPDPSPTSWQFPALPHCRTEPVWLTGSGEGPAPRSLCLPKAWPSTATAERVIASS